MSEWIDAAIKFALVAAYAFVWWRFGYAAGLRAEAKRQAGRQQLLRRLQEGQQ